MKETVKVLERVSSDLETIREGKEMARASMTKKVTGAARPSVRGSGERVVKCLFINPMPPELMARLRELADEQSPKVSRNSLILWILEEFAAGNLVHKATLPAGQVLESEVAA